MSFVLSVESLGKQFWPRRNGPGTLKEFLIRRLTGRYAQEKPFWALREVTFALEGGCTLGVIGHNGAGKSTLLRLVCGLGRPTTGRITRRGETGSLLELGSGFHPDLTGRENLVTGGILSGLSRGQVKAKEEEIISFAELEDFIDQPVRTYSSGMYLRLAFASTVHFHADLLVIDEILAVGDARFQQKCLDRLNSFHAAGKSLLLVSHDLAQVRNLCDEVLVLEEGRLVMKADPEAAIACYHDLMRQRTAQRMADLGVKELPARRVVGRGSRTGTLEAELTAVRCLDGLGRDVESIVSGDDLTIQLEFRTRGPLPDMAVTSGIFGDGDVKCFETCLSSVKTAFGPLARRGILRCHLPRVPLLPGRYYLNVGLYPAHWDYVYDYHWQMHRLYVLPANGRGNASGFVDLQPRWSVAAE